ncbi:hypothetical protein [Lacrimispora sp.]|uniref:hypothetical protein n=1 Tax=Lacrimispora sp. TaxID=2719234 RepID=UPI003461236C
MKEFTSFIAILGFRSFADFLLVIGALGAFLIYWWQKRAEKKTACTLILTQIDETEKAVDSLRRIENRQGYPIYKEPDLLNRNFWEENKVLLIRSLKGSDIDVLDRYYSNIFQIQKGKTELVEALKNSWKWRSLGYNLILKELEELTEEKAIKEKRECISKYEMEDGFFNPSFGIHVLTEGLNNFASIKGSTTYELLEKNSYRKN